MIGHKPPNHHDFGWASDQSSDLLNWVTERLVSLLIALTGSALHNRHNINKNAKLNPSANAVRPKVAMAYAPDHAGLKKL